MTTSIYEMILPMASYMRQNPDDKLTKNMKRSTNVQETRRIWETQDRSEQKDSTKITQTAADPFSNEY